MDYSLPARYIGLTTAEPPYDKPETMYGKLLTRKIQIYWDYIFCVIHFDLFLQKTFQITPEQN